MSATRTWPEVLLKLYKRLLSPFLPASCRYVPTCSEYAAEAVTHHGVFHGTTLACWRVMRCNPFVRGGYDPVPGVEMRDVNLRNVNLRNIDLRNNDSPAQDLPKKELRSSS